MKKYLALFFNLIIVISLYSQVPNAFNYQAVIRNTDGTIKSNEEISVKAQIIQGGIPGTVIYSEDHNVTTSALGLITLEIGNGETSLNFSSIDWNVGPFFLNIEINGISVGSTQLLSVPYAMYANEAANGFSGNYLDLEDIPTEFLPSTHTHSESEINDLNHYTDDDIDGNETAFSSWDKNESDDFDGDYNSLSNVPLQFNPFSHNHTESEITDLVHYSDADIDGTEDAFKGWDKDSTDDFNGSYTSLIDVPAEFNPSNHTHTESEISDLKYFTTADENDGDPTNELQVLSINGDTIKLSDGGYVIIPNSNILISQQITDVSCNGDNDGAIDITIESSYPPFRVIWDTESTEEDLINIAPGIYEVYVEDDKGRTAIKRIIVGEPDELISSIQSQDVSSVGNDGSITLNVEGGTPPYTFEWNIGEISQNIDNLTEGDYSVIITDSNGCTITDSISLSGPVQITESVSHAVCYGDFNGSIDITVSGGAQPYTYEWSHSEWSGTLTTEDISNLANGIYHVKVTDSNNYIVQKDITVFPESEIEIIVSHANNNIEGGSQGAVDLTVSGGHGNYSYLWSNGETSEDISGLAEGVYSVSITDEKGCIKNDTVFVLLVIPDYTSVTDYDNNTYSAVKIGDQVWMTTNLKSSHYSNGTAVPDGINAGNYIGEINPKYWFYYNDDPTTPSEFGYLYTWFAAINGETGSSTVPSNIQGVCPAGWHLPSDDEWDILIDYLGGDDIAGGKMKTTGLEYWNDPNLGATNESYFYALPSSYRFPDGTYGDPGNDVQWWSTTEYIYGDPYEKAYHVSVWSTQALTWKSQLDKTKAISVRCVKD